MRKIFNFLIISVLIFVLSGCGGGGGSNKVTDIGNNYEIVIYPSSGQVPETTNNFYANAYFRKGRVYGNVTWYSNAVVEINGRRLDFQGESYNIYPYFQFDSGDSIHITATCSEFPIAIDETVNVPPLITNVSCNDNLTDWLQRKIPSITVQWTKANCTGYYVNLQFYDASGHFDEGTILYFTDSPAVITSSSLPKDLSGVVYAKVFVCGVQRIIDSNYADSKIEVRGRYADTNVTNLPSSN
jgi:uncharacterized protein (UPF0303 family)